MSMQNPNDNTPEDEEINIDDVDQSDALRRAILKLKESGMLTHVPEDLSDITIESAVDTASSVTNETTEPEPQSSSPQEKQSVQASDDQTIASRPKPESPTIASTDDVEKHADERAKWAAVMSGWDDVSVPQPQSESESPPTIPSRPDSTSSATDDWALPESTEASEPISSVDEQAALTVRRKEILPEKDETALTSSREDTPWTLQQFFDGEIDLEQELLKRFPTVPAMTTIKFRTLGMNSSRKVATLSTQDGNASIIIDADVATKVVHMSFTFGSMMTLRYVLSDIPANNRDRWVDLMRREAGGLAFLWNEERWRDDYLICISRQFSTNIFAFSPRNFESAVRLTNDVAEELLNWLEDVWTSDPEPENDDDSPLLTW